MKKWKCQKSFLGCYRVCVYRRNCSADPEAHIARSLDASSKVEESARRPITDTDLSVPRGLVGENLTFPFMMSFYLLLYSKLFFNEVWIASESFFGTACLIMLSLLYSHQSLELLVYSSRETLEGSHLRLHLSCMKFGGSIWRKLPLGQRGTQYLEFYLAPI